MDDTTHLLSHVSQHAAHTIDITTAPLQHRRSCTHLGVIPLRWCEEESSVECAVWGGVRCSLPHCPQSPQQRVVIVAHHPIIGRLQPR